MVSAKPTWLQATVLSLAISMMPRPYWTQMSTQLSESIIKEAVGKLYSAAPTDRENAKHVLLSLAKESTETRNVIVKAAGEVLVMNSQAQPTRIFSWGASLLKSSVS
jgi:hypothetical protein